MKKSYIIVGDNNFWYAMTAKMTKKEAVMFMKIVLKDIKQGEYTDQVDSMPTSLFLFESKEVAALDF